MNAATVHANPGARTRGLIHLGPIAIPCALGRSGISHAKREGDGATPTGRLRLVEVLYRADRISRPETRLPVRRIARDDGWCDAPEDRNYNRAVKRPYPASHEAMWRDDALYDIVIVLDWNWSRRRKGRGSAIFLHLARPNFAPTEGCVAVRPADMRAILRRLGPGAALRIG